MERDAISNISVSLEIPSGKVYAQAMDVFDQYKPIVEEALQEARKKLLFDDAFRQEIKYLIIERVEQAMKDGIKRAAENVVRDAYYENYRDIEQKVSDFITEKKIAGTGI